MNLCNCTLPYTNPKACENCPNNNNYVQSAVIRNTPIITVVDASEIIQPSAIENILNLFNTLLNK